MDQLSVTEFVQGFVAQLIEADAVALRPKSEQDREGFGRVVDTLNSEIARLRRASPKGEDLDWYRSLVLLRNELQASSSGAFDGFERALRNLQLSFTNSPNPFYEEIAFSVSKPFASAVFDDLPHRAQELAKRAAVEFLTARRQALA